MICIKKDVAIFAHCTPTGFQTYKHEGLNAHPKYWREVLEKSQWSNLRLCLGHAGGECLCNKDVDTNQFVCSPGWMAKSDEEWNNPNNFARIVAELCTTYPNVYCEVGHILPLFEPDNVEIFIANIERARKAAKESQRPYDLLDKMAYGSDWHMQAMIDKTREYLEVFLEIMNREAYRSYLDKFFWQNAYKFLKLVP
jgi:predicted TIM-barrel fold metal-dependent hydrolase